MAKTKIINVKADAAFVNKVDLLCDATGLDRSKILRLGIDRLYQEMIDEQHVGDFQVISTESLTHIKNILGIGR
jgi:hypothetical protein